MIDFNKIKYKRIDFDKTKLILEKLVCYLKETTDFNVYLSIVME